MRWTGRLLVLCVLLLGAGVLYRLLQATTAPNAAVDHPGPLPGSLDSWPPVPAAPSAEA
jgi:hypothetical protein